VHVSTECTLAQCQKKCNKIVKTIHKGWSMTKGHGGYSYLLTPWSRVLLEKLTASATSQDIPRIFGTRKFLTVLTSPRVACCVILPLETSPPPPPPEIRVGDVEDYEFYY
jgi:hypothetical protein